MRDCLAKKLSAVIVLTFNIGIANNTPNSVVVGLSALDFTSLNQSGGIRFLTTTQQKESNLHYLASSLSFVLPQLALAPSQNIVTPVTINNANQLSPGGHYAAVIFKINSAPLKDTKNPVNISPAICFHRVVIYPFSDCY